MPLSAPDSSTPTHFSFAVAVGAVEEVGVDETVDVTKVETEPGWH